MLNQPMSSAMITRTFGCEVPELAIFSSLDDCGSGRAYCPNQRWPTTRPTSWRLHRPRPVEAVILHSLHGSRFMAAGRTNTLPLSSVFDKAKSLRRSVDNLGRSEHSAEAAKSGKFFVTEVHKRTWDMRTPLRRVSSSDISWPVCGAPHCGARRSPVESKYSCPSRTTAEQDVDRPAAVSLKGFGSEARRRAGAMMSAFC